MSEKRPKWNIFLLLPFRIKITRLLKKIVIAIDGHSSCGKSTLAKDLAAIIGYAYVDSGAMYRAVTHYFLVNKIDIQNTQEVNKALNNINIRFKCLDNGRNTTFLNNENVEDAIRSMKVSEFVSPVAAIPEVRKKLVEEQRKMGIDKGIVMDGRDIGTVVFPEAELKIFLTAELAIRVERRYKEMLDNNIHITKEEVQENLIARDHIDSTREDSPLTQANDALLLDNSHLTRKQQLEKVLEWVNLKQTI